MSQTSLETGAGWQPLDERTMADLDGGGPFAEFVYDVTHSVVTALRFLYEVRPQYGPGQAGWAAAKTG